MPGPSVSYYSHSVCPCVLSCCQPSGAGQPLLAQHPESNATNSISRAIVPSCHHAIVPSAQSIFFFRGSEEAFDGCQIEPLGLWHRQQHEQGTEGADAGVDHEGADAL